MYGNNNSPNKSIQKSQTPLRLSREETLWRVSKALYRHILLSSDSHNHTQTHTHTRTRSSNCLSYDVFNIEHFVRTRYVVHVNCVPQIYGCSSFSQVCMYVCICMCMCMYLYVYVYVWYSSFMYAYVYECSIVLTNLVIST